MLVPRTWRTPCTCTCVASYLGLYVGKLPLYLVSDLISKVVHTSLHMHCIFTNVAFHESHTGTPQRAINSGRDRDVIRFATAEELYLGPSHTFVAICGWQHGTANKLLQGEALREASRQLWRLGQTKTLGTKTVPASPINTAMHVQPTIQFNMTHMWKNWFGRHMHPYWHWECTTSNAPPIKFCFSYGFPCYDSKDSTGCF